MVVTKYVALDIFGTLLALRNDFESLPARKGHLEFFQKCKALDVKVISASDAYLGDLEAYLSYFDLLPYFYALVRFEDKPKEFDAFIHTYRIKPRGLFVIGDTPEKDIEGAKKAGANYFLQPPE